MVLMGPLHQHRWFMEVVLHVLLEKGSFPGWGEEGRSPSQTTSFIEVHKTTSREFPMQRGGF